MTDSQDELFESVWSRAKPALIPLLPPMTTEQWYLLKATVKQTVVRTIVPLLERDTGLVRAYYSAGVSDLTAADTLYGAKVYALAVYHLQQTAEKATKSLCLALGRTDKDMLLAAHRSPQPLLSLLTEEYGRTAMALASTIADKNYRRMLKRAQSFVNSDAAGQEQLRRLPFSKNRHGPSITVFVELADNLAKVPDQILDAERRVKDVLIQCLPEYEAEIRQSVVSTVAVAALQCYVLGTITFVHESSTRYPGGETQPSDYDGDMGIVQAIPALLERMSRMMHMVAETAREVTGQ